MSTQIPFNRLSPTLSGKFNAITLNKEFAQSIIQTPMAIKELASNIIKLELILTLLKPI